MLSIVLSTILKNSIYLMYKVPKDIEEDYNKALVTKEENKITYAMYILSN